MKKIFARCAVPAAALCILLAGCSLRPASSAPPATPAPTPVGEPAATADPTPAVRTPTVDPPAQQTPAAGPAALDYDEMRPVEVGGSTPTGVLEGYFTVSRDGKWGLIRADGTEILPCLAETPVARCLPQGHWMWSVPAMSWEEVDAKTAELEAAGEAGICNSAPVTGFENLSGRGLSAELGGERVLVGSPRLMEESGVDASALSGEAARLSGEGKTVMFVARGGELLGAIAVADPVRETSAAAIARLKEMGLRVVLLTGDNRRAANYIGAQVGADEVIAEVLPGDKADVVRSIQEKGGRVIMVGDGINDAPALTQADVGCAVGGGSDIAIESADVVLMKDDLGDVPKAVRLSRLTITNIKENLFWAFCYNTIGIPIAAGVLYPFFEILLSPMLGALAMSLSSVCVVGNALRLRGKKL